MPKPNFRTYRGKWITKPYVLKATAGAILKGDLIGFGASGTIELASDNSICIIGIVAKDYANSGSVQTIYVQIPAEPLAEMIGPVIEGVMAVGVTDSGRCCDIYSDYGHGASADTDSMHSLYIVRGTKATADGTSAAGEAIFRIADPPKMSGR